MFLASFLAALVFAFPSDSLALGADDGVASLPAVARQAAVPDTAGMIRLKDVVVTATRTPVSRLAAPASVSVVVPDALTPSQSPQSSLAQIAGAGFGARGGQGSASSLFLRGASSENVLVLLDGIPLNSPLLGSYDLNKISGNVDRIEVVRGPASSLYGANAVGGVINIATVGPREKRPYSRITYEKGSSGTQLLRAKFSRAMSEKLFMWLGADWNSTGGQLVNSAYDGTNYALGATIGPFGGFTTTAYFQGYQSEVGVPFGWNGSQTPYDKQSDQQQDVSLRLSRGADSGSWSGGGAVSIARSTVTNKFLYRDFYQNDVAANNDSRLSTVDGQYSFALSPSLTLTAGGAYQRAECTSDVSNEHDPRQHSAFSTVQFAALKDLLLNAGARYDKNTYYPSQLSPTVSASYLVTMPGDWRLAPYVNFGRAFRAPVIDDLFWPVQIYDANPAWGNPDASKLSGNIDLAPESSTQAELGVKAAAGPWAAQFAAYRRRTDHLIDWTNTVRIASADTAFPDTLYQYPVNRGRVVSDGCELSATYTPWPWLIVDANYSYNVTVQDTIGRPSLPYRPRNVANGSLAVNDLRLAEHLRLGWKLAARYTDCQDPGPNYAAVLPRAVICDQTLSFKVRDARIYWRVDNLFNAEYQTRAGYPMPRRSYAFGVSLELWD